MTTLGTGRRLPRAAARALRRRGERGAAVFIVVLVIAMLTTIGVFAASSASLATAASGGARQTMQAHFVAEYAMLTATAELSTPRLDAYVSQMGDPSNTTVCANENTTSGTRSCYVFGKFDLEKMVQQQTPGATMFVPAAGSGLGSLGPAGVDADFRVEVTDLGPASTPVTGSDLTSAGATNISYMSVTLTGIARTFLTNQVGVPASLHATRAHLIVGPLPKSF